MAISCAGRATEQDNVETGGDSLFGRDFHYFLVRAGKVLRSHAAFDGDYSY